MFFLFWGDTNSCLTSITAKRRKIPVFHMEAGNRCFDQRVPEEINRKLVDHISDINLVYTEHARRYLLAEGLKPETIIKTGSPMKEVLSYYMDQIKGSDVLKTLKVDPGNYFVVSSHREENVDNPALFSGLLESLNQIALKYKIPVIFSTHPRTQRTLDGLPKKSLDSRILFLKPLGFLDYVRLQMEAYCVLSDSGTLMEESSILNFPAVLIREAHERPEGMDEGTLIMSGLSAGRVIEAVEIARSQYTKETRVFRLVQDYDTDNVSKKVLRIIYSYTDYVNRTVWNK